MWENEELLLTGDVDNKISLDLFCTEQLWSCYVHQRHDMERLIKNVEQSGCVMCIFLLVNVDQTALFYWSRSTKKSAAIKVDSTFHDLTSVNFTLFCQVILCVSRCNL